MTKKYVGWLAAAAVAAIATLYYIFNPLTSSWAPKCVFHAMTGLDCPGCGSQRMLHALLHGNFIEAWHANAFIICLIPLLLLMGYAALMREKHPRLYARLNSMPMIIILFVAILSWTILRNI